MNFSQGNHKLRMKNVYERENPILKNRITLTFLVSTPNSK